MRAHLLKLHEVAAAHHTQMGKLHHQLHRTHGDLSEHHDEAGDETAAEHHERLSKTHKELAAAHVAHAEHHLAMHKALTARGDWREGEVEPDEPSARGGHGDVPT